MLTLTGEHSDTICLNLQAPGFAGVMCSGESDSTELQPPKSGSDWMIWLGKVRVKRKTGTAITSGKLLIQSSLLKNKHLEMLCKKLWKNA
jgi:hypothetical protein